MEKINSVNLTNLESTHHVELGCNEQVQFTLQTLF